MKQKLTVSRIRQLRCPPTQTRFALRDTVVPGLSVRVTPKGTKTFTFTWRRANRQHRVTLHRWPLAPEAHQRALEDARTQALALETDVCRGGSPGVAVSQVGSLTVEQLVHEYIVREARASGLKTWAAIERTLDLHLVSAIGHLPIAEVSRRDVLEILDRLMAEGKPGACGNVRKATSRLFNYAADRGHLAVSPVAGMRYRPLKKRTNCGRDLDDEELWAVWRASSEERAPARQLLQLLILTGSRRSEWADAGWSELDEDSRTLWIKPDRYKTGVAHSVPLSGAAWGIVKDVPRWPGSDWIISYDGTAPFRAWGRMKKRVELAANRHLGRPLERWRLHDLRVTVRTGMARQGVPPHIAELVLGHVPPALVRTYNKHLHVDERRDALERWGEHVMGVVDRGPR